MIDWDKHTIRGTNTKLEKSYLRLTTVSRSLSYHGFELIPYSQEPSPADIRPLHILQQTLQFLKAKWKQNHNYGYAVDQFKSMRQDLTVSRYEVQWLETYSPLPQVQRIKNEFTVEVYEIHARIALEAVRGLIIWRHR